MLGIVLGIIMFGKKRTHIKNVSHWIFSGDPKGI